MRSHRSGKTAGVLLAKRRFAAALLTKRITAITAITAITETSALPYSESS
ncbi:MAG: hypothetical protein ACO22T_00640 [Burkholderiales bacterium]